jgi:hypothetical protein
MGHAQVRDETVTAALYPVRDPSVKLLLLTRVSKLYAGSRGFGALHALVLVTRAGCETIQVYASRQDSSVERPVRWLAGFAKAGAEPGGEVTADIPVPLRRLAHWDTADGTWAVEPGEYQLAIGRSSRNLPLRTTITVSPAQASYDQHRSDGEQPG